MKLNLLHAFIQTMVCPRHARIVYSYETMLYHAWYENNTHRNKQYYIMLDMKTIHIETNNIISYNKLRWSVWLMVKGGGEGWGRPENRCSVEPVWVGAMSPCYLGTTDHKTLRSKWHPNHTAHYSHTRTHLVSVVEW